MRNIFCIIAAMLLLGCSDSQRQPLIPPYTGAIKAHDMGNNVRCYTFGAALSCVRIPH